MQRSGRLYLSTRTSQVQVRLETRVKPKEDEAFRFPAPLSVTRESVPVLNASSTLENLNVMDVVAGGASQDQCICARYVCTYVHTPVQVHVQYGSTSSKRTPLETSKTKYRNIDNQRGLGDGESENSDTPAKGLEVEQLENTLVTRKRESSRVEWAAELASQLEFLNLMLMLFVETQKGPFLVPSPPYPLTPTQH